MTTPVISLSPHDPVATAIDVFVEHGFAHLPVVDGERLAGILSDRDALRLIARGEAAWQTEIGRIMRAPLTVGWDVPLEVAADLMRSEHVHCLPVVDAAGRLCGIITTSDLLGCLSRLLVA